MIHLVFDTSTPMRRVSLGDEHLTKAEAYLIAKEQLEELYGCSAIDFYLLHNGRLLDKDIYQGDVYVVPRLLGGKGGFGSMLRAIGAQIEKTTNREACRDLSGRRLRDINEEKRLKKWLAEQAEREQEALLKKKKKLEKLKNDEIKHEFKDEEYIKARLEMPEKIHEAVEEGLKASLGEPSTSQTSSEEIKVEVKAPVAPKKKKRKLWVDDLLEDSDSASDIDSESESPKKKIKLS